MIFIRFIHGLALAHRLDTMGPFYKEWSDSDGHPPRINSKTWHRRLTRTPCSQCHILYRPALDRQRYCEGCALWFHVECIGEDSEEDFEEAEAAPKVDPSEADEEGFPLVWRSILTAPSVRGHHGHYDFENNWLITGSGTQKQMIKGWVESKVIPENWEALLGENFLYDIVSKEFRAYDCPACDAKI